MNDPYTMRGCFEGQSFVYDASNPTRKHSANLLRNAFHREEIAKLFNNIDVSRALLKNLIDRFVDNILESFTISFNFFIPNLFAKITSLDVVN